MTYVQTVQGLIGIAMAWYGPQIAGSERGAKKLYKYHRYVTMIPYRKSLLMGRLSGYILLLLVLSTAHLGGAHSTWALSKGGVMKVTRILAFWVGLPAIALGLVIRTR
jgi:cytochrome b-561 domain-containing protein 2